MQIKKVLNNNVVVVETADQKEMIVMGRGIAFQKKTGDFIQEELIEKTFILETAALSEKLKELLSDIPLAHLRVADDIVQYAQEKLETDLKENIYLTLTDHVNFAISRYKKGIHLKNALLWEIKRFYREEFHVGLQALAFIQKETGVELDEDEAGFIALHLVNARVDKQQIDQTVVMTNIVQDILGIVKYHYGVVLDESSLNYTRFVTHLQYVAQRIINGELIESQDDFLYEHVKRKYNRAFKCMEKINHYLEAQHQVMLSRDECVYLTIHIFRVMERDTKELDQF